MNKSSNIKNELLNREIPEEFIEEWTRAVSETKAETKKNEITLALFILGGKSFALSSDIFLETQPFKNFHSVPFRSSAYFKGLVNVNGELILYIDLPAILEQYKRDDKDKKLILSVITDGKDKYCFTAESFEGVIQISREELSDSPVTVKANESTVSKATFNYQDSTVDLIDEAKLFEKLDKVIKW